MGLRDIGESLPPGFRFYPSDEELVCHYLYKKIANEEVVRGTLVEIDLHVCEPWQLPDVAKLNSNEWYFFSFRDRKYATGFRTNRATISGYWKATGKDRVVINPRTRSMVGMRKTLVFYRNRAPNGIKTGWIMHEFRLENPHVPPKEDWVLCRVFHKSRSGESGSCSNKMLIGSSEDYNHEAGSSTCPTNNMPVINSHPNNKHANMAHSYCDRQSTNPTTSLGLFAIEPTPYLPLPMPDHHHTKINNYMGGQTRCEDDYGFMFDFDASDNGVPSSLDEMGFDDDNGSVFV